MAIQGARRAAGFSLIELIVVIVILGILGATSAPQFVSLSSDARQAAVESLQASLATGAKLVYAKSLLEGKDSGNDYLDYDNDGDDDISIRSGYPRVASSCANFLDGLSYWMDMQVDAACVSDTSAEWYGVVDRNMFYFMPNGFTTTSENCYVTYTTASVYDTDLRQWVDTNEATIESTISGC